MSLTLDPVTLARRRTAETDDYYQVGQAWNMLIKAGGAPVAAPVLHGRLIVPKSGWALLTVPNAIVHGLFDAMDETGIELPPGHEDGPFNAHISVMTGDEIDKLGGPDKITERGHPFTYQLGPIKSVEPKGWSEMSRVWFVKVISPELKALRRSYGLSPLPNGDHDFHVSIAVRRKKVLSSGPVSKAAGANDDQAIEAWQSRNQSVQHLAGNDRTLRESEARAIQGLRWPGDQGLPKVATELPGIPGGHGGAAAGDGDRTTKKLAGLHALELLLGDAKPECKKQAEQQLHHGQRGHAAADRMGGTNGHPLHHDPHSDQPGWLVAGGGAGRRDATQKDNQLDRARWRTAVIDKLGAATRNDTDHTQESHPAMGSDSGDDDEGDKKALKIPLCMQRIVITRLTFGKPDGADSADNGADITDGIEEFMDRLRKRHGETKTAGAAQLIGPLAKGLSKAAPAIISAGRQAFGAARPALAAARPVLVGAGRQALSAAKPALANLGQRALSTGATAARTIGAGAAKLGPAAQAVGQRAVGAVAPAARATGEHARFMAGLPEGERFLSSPLGAVKNIARAAYSPRYPIFDRPLGAVAAARPWDRTRSLIGKSLGNASWTGLGVGLGEGARSVWEAPNAIAEELSKATGYTGDREALRKRIQRAMGGIYWEGAKDLVGLGSKDPASRFMGGVARDVALPSMRHSLHQALGPAGPVTPLSTLNMTTPYGIANTMGVFDPAKQTVRSVIGAEHPPDVASAAKARVPEFLQGAKENPEALAASPYAQIVADVLPREPEVAQEKPREMAANVAGRWGHATPAQQEQILTAGTTPGEQPYNPTVGELQGKAKHWAAVATDPAQRRQALDQLQQRLPEGQRNTLGMLRQLTPEQRRELVDRVRASLPEKYQQRISNMQRLLPGKAVSAVKAGAARSRAVTALARLTSEKRAIDPDVRMPALLGAGLGGFGGWGLGQLLGSKRPWRDAVYGAGAGGLAGIVAGSRTTPMEPPAMGDEGRPQMPAPPDVTQETLAENLERSHYYDKARGGLKGVLSRAVEHQESLAPGIAAPKYTKEDVYTPIKITRKLGPKLSGKNLGQSTTWWSPVRTVPPTIEMVREDMLPRNMSAQQIKEHELTHSALEGLPSSRSWLRPITVDEPWGSGKATLESLGKKTSLTTDENYRLSSSEFDPRLAQIKRFYAREHPGEDVDTPAKAQTAMKWFRKWITTAKGKQETGGFGDQWREVFDMPEWDEVLRDAAARRMPGLVNISRRDMGTKVAAVSPATLAGRKRRRRPLAWTAGALGRLAAKGALIGGGGYAAGRGMEDIGKRLAFEPNPSWQLSEANQAVQNAPDITGAVNEYVTKFPLALNEPIYGKKTPFEIMRDLRTEGTPLRNLPMVSTIFPPNENFANSAHHRSHYTNFAKGPATAYKTLLREYLSEVGESDAGEILGGMDVVRPKILEQSARNVLGRNPNATAADFMKEYGNQIVQTHAPTPSKPLISGLGPISDAMRMSGGWSNQPATPGILGGNPIGKEQAGVTLRRLALNLEKRLPVSGQAEEYFRHAKPIFEQGTLTGDDKGMAALAAKMSPQGQSAAALGLSPATALHESAAGPVPPTFLRKKLTDRLEEAIKQLGHAPTPAEQAELVKRVSAPGDPWADLAALKIDKHLAVGGASGMYDQLNKVLSLPGHAARLAQKTAPYLKAIAPAAGLGLAGYGLYKYLNPPVRAKRKPKSRPVAPSYMPSTWLPAVQSHMPSVEMPAMFGKAAAAPPIPLTPPKLPIASQTSAVPAPKPAQPTAFSPDAKAALKRLFTPAPLPVIHQSLAENIEPYYEKAPGGLPGVLDRALRYQTAASPKIGTPTYTKEDVYRKFPITFRPGADMQKFQSNAAGGAVLELMHSKFEEPGYKPGDPPVTVSVADPKKTTLLDTKTKAPLAWNPTQYKQHGLTHAAMQGQPIYRAMTAGKPSGILSTEKYRSGRALVEAENPPGVKPHEISDFLNYSTSSAELDPHLAQIKRFYSLAHPGEDVRTPEEAHNAIKWFREWLGTKEAPNVLGNDVRNWQAIFAHPDWSTIEETAVRRMPRLVQNALVMPDSMKLAAAPDVSQPTHGTLRGDLANTGRQILDFHPEPGRQFSEANRRVKAAPGITEAVSEYTAGYPLGMNQPAYGNKTPLDMMRDLRTERTPLRRRIPFASKFFPPGENFAVNPEVKEHYEGFARGPVSAYKTLMHEHLQDNDAPDILGGLDTARPKLLEQAARNVLSRNPNASTEEFLKEYSNQIIKTHVPKPPSDPIGALGPVADVLRMGGSIPPRPEVQGLLGPNPIGKEQAAITLRRFTQDLENRLPPGEQAASYFERAKPFFQPGTRTGDATALAGLATQMSRPGQAAEALKLSPDTPLPANVAGPVRPPNLRNTLSGRLDQAMIETTKQLGHPPTPVEQANLVRRVTTGSPEADLAAMKIDKELTVRGASGMYNTLSHILSAPGQAARVGQGAVSSVKNIPAAGAAAGRSLYQHAGPLIKAIPRPAIPGKAPVPVMPASMKKAAADYAPGLPSRTNLGPFDRLRVNQLLDFVVQQHDAERAGRHYDVRFGDKNMGLLSWAARKGLPEPGAKHLAVQQPVHRHGYKDFEGEIPEGYGKGKVKKHTEGQVLITKVTPESVHFTTAHQRHPERFTLARPKGWGNKNWLLMNTTPREQVPYEKVRYKKIPAEQVEPAIKAMQEGDTAEAKVDGASQLVQLAKGHAEMLSFRTSKTTGRPIFHTERFFGGRPDIPVPKHLEGSILKGEMYASRPGRPQERGAAGGGTAMGAGPEGGAGPALPASGATAAPGGPAGGTRLGPQDVGTLLNSSIARSLQIQKERGLTLKNMLYDVQQYGKKPIDPAVTPRNERRKMLEEIAGHLPKDKFHVSEQATDPKAATKLWNMIRSGQHPLTEEGAVFHPRVGIPSKAKLMEEHDVHLTGTFSGEGKRKATVGGFTYGHEPGKTVGKVGTGFSDEFLKEVARDPFAYVGRVARLRSQQKLPSGALRVPSFIGLHEDINKVAEVRGPEGEYCPHCDARQERGDDGRCNRCGKLWPEPKAGKQAGFFKVAAAGGTVAAAPAVPELPPNPFGASHPEPAPPAYPSPTGVAVKQLSAPSLPPLPTGRAGPAMSQVRKVLASNPTGADRLFEGLYNSSDLRRNLTAASRAGGYPADPGAAPASTVALLGRTLPHKLPPTRFENQPTAKANYRGWTGQTTLSDPFWAGSGPAPSYSPEAQANQQWINDMIPNRLGIIRHETEHALQDMYQGPMRRIPEDVSPAEFQKHVEAIRRENTEREYAREIPAALGDLPYIAQAHKLETGKPLNAPVTVAPGITHDADWMARQAEQHGMFGGRTTTELLATPSGQAYLRRLLAAQGQGIEKQNAAHPALADLKKAKFESDRRNYAAKHYILSKLLDKHPGEFVRDSAGRGVVGLLHKPTGFKIHAPIRVVRGRVKAAALEDLARPAIGALAGGGAGLLGEYVTRGRRPASTSRRLGFGLGGALAGALGGVALNPTATPSPPPPSTPTVPSDVLWRSKSLRKELGGYLDQMGVVPSPVTGTGRRLRLIDDRDVSNPLPPLGFDEDKAVRLRKLLDSLNLLDKGAATKQADLLPWVSLQPQQKRVAKRVGEGQNLLVYHGLGSGKSLAGIAAAEGVGGPYTAIVPASLRPNYQGEIAKFTNQASPSEVMSYTGVGMGRQPRQTPNTVIMDEVQRLRNPASEGSQAAMRLAMQAPHRVLLSGTPIVNAPSDLAVPLSILSGEEMSPAAFNKQFVGTKTVNPGLMGWFQGVQPTKVPTLQNEEDLERMLEGKVDYQASRTPKGVKTRDEKVEVDLSPEQQEFYKLMWGKLPWVMRWKLSNDYPLSGPELAHLSSFMTGPRQAALSLYPYHSSKDPMYAFKTSSKLQAAMGSLKKTLGKDPRAKAIVYSNFIDAGLVPYSAALTAEGIPHGLFHGTMSEEDRKKALEDYNAGKSRVLLLGPAAAEGISAKGTQLIQLMDPHWNEARLGQARGRGLRFDSHEGLPPELRNVRIQRFVAKMPPPGWLGRMFGAEARPSADEVLEQQARHKEELNEQFREVLRRVGSPGYQRPWHLFG